MVSPMCSIRRQGADASLGAEKNQEPPVAMTLTMFEKMQSNDERDLLTKSNIFQKLREWWGCVMSIRQVPVVQYLAE